MNDFERFSIDPRRYTSGQGIVSAICEVLLFGFAAVVIFLGTYACEHFDPRAAVSGFYCRPDTQADAGTE